MIATTLQRLRQFGLIALVALMLLGVQLIQASPLHDHQHESVDCALCHTPTLGDDSELTHSQPPVVKQVSAPINTQRHSYSSLLSPAPYQGRAPPVR